MIGRNRLAALCGLLTLYIAGCALPPAAHHASGILRVPIAVTNDTPDLVRVLFVSETGHRRYLTTVPPHSSARVSSVLLRDQVGHFYVHRLSTDAPTELPGVVDALGIGGRTVQIRIGAIAAFDWWQVEYW